MQGWVFKCEKGGIRRILMNLFGNSLKFTSVCLGKSITFTQYQCIVVICQDGYVHVMLRRQPPAPEMSTNEVKLELSVIDTGKVGPRSVNGCELRLTLHQGISQSFLKVGPFHVLY